MKLITYQSILLVVRWYSMYLYFLNFRTRLNAPSGYVGADVADWVKRLEAKNISSRLLSNIVSAQPAKVQQECAVGACFNSFYTTFAQFCYLDMTHSTGSSEKWNLPIPKDGLLDRAGTQTSSFTRSKYEGGSTDVRKQINSNRNHRFT